jgi:hypothetical protein
MSSVVFFYIVTQSDIILSVMLDVVMLSVNLNVVMLSVMLDVVLLSVLLYVVMLSVILNIVMQSAMLDVVMLSVMLDVVMLSVMLNVVVLSIMEPGSIHLTSITRKVFSKHFTNPIILLSKLINSIRPRPRFHAVCLCLSKIMLNLGPVL